MIDIKQGFLGAEITMRNAAAKAQTQPSRKNAGEKSCVTRVLIICRKKHDIFAKQLLTFSGGSDYNPVTDEGGGAAGDEVSRSEESHDRLAECWLGPSFGLVPKFVSFGFCDGGVFGHAVSVI